MSEHSPAVGLSLCAAVPKPTPVPPLSAVELDAYADFLAWELAYDQVRACDRHVDWYQQQLGEAKCGFSDAAALRLRVMYLCREEALRRARTQAAGLVGLPEIHVHPRVARISAGLDERYMTHRLTRRAIVRVLASTLAISLLAYAAITCCAGKL